MTGDLANLDPAFKAELEALEREAGIALTVTSGYRDPAKNATVGGVQRSAHTEGPPCKAADIACPSSQARFTLVALALAKGFTRIGIGPNFIHLDRSTALPQKVMWTYYPPKGA